MLAFEKRPFGVNLIGHAFEMFGIGEDVRMAARALQAADVPCCVIHHPAANGASCDDRTLEPLSVMPLKVDLMPTTWSVWLHQFSSLDA